LERITRFSDIPGHLAGCRKMRIAVAGADDPEVLQSLARAAERQLVHPLLIGNPDAIEKMLDASGLNFPSEIVKVGISRDVGIFREVAEAAASLAGSGEADAVMKGSIPTDILMRAILDSRFKLRTDTLVSHVTVSEMPGLEKMILITDAAVNISPDVSKKRQIIQNAVAAARALGVACPVTAVLCAVEKVRDSMQATLDAAELQRLSQEGVITGTLVSGPLSLDLAISSAAARIKGVADAAAGKADILLVPEIETGNVLVKSLSLIAGLAHGGLVVGAKVPVVLASRSDSADSKYHSLLLCALLVQGEYGDGRN
jgi:phosphate butyryltransferase